MLGAREGIGVAVSLPLPEFHAEVMVGEDFQPAEDHAFGFLDVVDPFEGLVVRAEDERPVAEVILPLADEKDGSKKFTFV